jgi:hypothetical protein
LSKYVDSIKDEKVKMQRFLSGLPSFYNENIQHDNPKTLEETIRRSRNLYEKRKGRSVFQKAWNDKLRGKNDQRKKGFKTPNGIMIKMIPKKIIKVKNPKMSTRLQNHLGKGQGSNLYTVGDVREITYIGTSLRKDKG